MPVFLTVPSFFAWGNSNSIINYHIGPIIFKRIQHLFLITLIHITVYYEHDHLLYVSHLSSFQQV